MRSKAELTGIPEPARVCEEAHGELEQRVEAPCGHAWTIERLGRDLGPCNPAPVIQVFPEGTHYGGVDEAAIAQIIEQP